MPVQFGKVNGNFYCEDNQVVSLQGAPTRVGGNFWCGINQLVSLQGAPTQVGGNFYCNYNKLTSLQGAPTQVGGDFYCDDNKLTSLQGAPGELEGTFVCDYTSSLPLLQLLVYRSLKLFDAPILVKDILKKYQGTTNPGDILRCASELNEAGFEGNAEW